MASIPLAERFWQKVDIRGPDDCWEWKAGRDNGDYGMFWYKNRTIHAQRVAWWLTHGDFPSETMTLHTCDNRPCCNPGHLFQGTNLDNHRDMCRKGRNARGERHGSRTKPEKWHRGEQVHGAKLTEAAVRSIRSEYAAGGVTLHQLARKWQVRHTAIWEVVRRISWLHIQD